MLSAGISGRQRGSPPSRPQGRFPLIITKIDRESTAEKWERSQKQKNICCFWAIFLLCLALLYFTDHRSAGGGDYTVTPQYTAQEPEAPDPPAVPGKVNINTADAAQLEALDGIGPTLAQRIVAYREEHGPFADIESIMDVNGIGEGIFETIRQQITVEDDT